MKKWFSMMLCVLLVLSMAAMAGCGAQQLRFGVGVQASVSDVKDAQADANGVTEVDQTVAAVLLDGNGKIVAATIDVLAVEAAYTGEGKFVPATQFTTKREAGDSYGMVQYAGSAKEWYQQADAFCQLLIGKTADEVKALVAADYKGTADVINAGCTIYVSDFALAVEKAIANAKDCAAKATDTLRIGMAAAQGDCKDASEDADGINNVVTDIAAVTLDAEGKVTAAMTDALDVSVNFDNSGAGKTAKGTAVASKRAQGDNYGMTKYGQDLNKDGKVLEWYQQADALDAALIGKNASDIGALVVNGYGVEAIQTAGCTIAISSAVNAIVKAATVA